MLFIRHHLANKKNKKELEQMGSCPVIFSRQVSSLTVNFLIDLFPAEPRFMGEAGVSYLVSADDRNVLFDLGYNPKERFLTPLRQNLEALGLDEAQLDGIFISHNHLDHVGGMKHQAARSPDLEQLPPEMLRGAAIWTPPGVHHHSHECTEVPKPVELLPGLASTGAMPAHLYFLGLIREQGLIISMKHKGVALIMGCGHPGAVEMVRHVKRITRQPVYAVVGGLHLIAGKGRTRTQKYLGANQPPWRSPDLAQVRRSIEELRELGVERLAPSAHDSCDAALATMREVFGAGYTEVRAGGSVTLSP